MSSSLILHKSNYFSDCDIQWKVDFIWQPVITRSLVDWEETPKHFLKVKLAPKKVMVTALWSAAGLIHYSFHNPVETITYEKYGQQTDEMQCKLQHLQPALVNRMAKFFPMTMRGHM